MINNIQVLRAVAALLVVCVHLDYLFGTFGLPKFGAGGVDLFFVISGFVMVHTTQAKKVSAASFMRNRIARIVPIYWTMTLAVFLVALLVPSWLKATSSDPLQLVKSLLFIPFMKSNGLVQPTLFVGWTLNYEMFFYACFAIGLLLPNYRAGLATVIAALVLLVVAGRLVDDPGVLFGFYTNPVMLEFALGILLAWTLPHFPQRKGIAMNFAALILVLAGLGAIVVAPLLAPDLPLLVTSGLPAAFVVGGALLLERWRWRISAVWAIAIGDASYAIYLSHPFVTQVFQKLGTRLGASGALSTMLILGAFLAVIAAGWLLHRGVEKPMTDIARRWLLGGGASRMAWRSSRQGSDARQEAG